MIYLIEDDDAIRELVVYTLNNSGYETKGFAKPSAFWKELKKEIPSLILLDLMLPEEDGLRILKKLRDLHDTKYVPIMILSAKSSEYDKVIGLDYGADDYVPKPFGMMELVARVKALLRRTEERKQSSDCELGNLYVCPAKHIVKVDGEVVNLTYKEFEMLNLLLQNRGLVFSRDQILSRIWEYEFDGESRTVDVHIRTLRQKLKSAGKYIETVRGIGYKIGDGTNA